MRLFTSASDKVFLCMFLVLAALMASTCYFFVQGQSVAMTKQKNDDRYNNFVHSPTGVKFELTFIGTSHSEKWMIMGSTPVAALTAAHTIPTVMYFKAKTIIKYHPEIKVVYLEADDHLFFNGTAYTLDDLNPTQKRESKVFEWGSNFMDGDEELEKVFGEVAPYSAPPRLLLQDDVRPIVIKRIVASIFSHFRDVNIDRASPTHSGNSCDFSIYPSVVDVSRNSPWSARTQADKDQRMAERITEHRLDQPGPMNDTMLEYYEKTIKLLKDHNIDVVLVLNPEVQEFEARKNPVGQKLHQDFLHKLAVSYHLRVLDFRGLSKQYGERIFEDQDHIADTHGWMLGKGVMQDFCSHELAR